MEFKKELENIIKMSVKDLMPEFEQESFSREEEVQWFLHHLLKHRVNEFLKSGASTKLVVREWPTHSKFIRVDGKLKKVLKGGRSGVIDLVIFDPTTAELRYDEKKVLVGIEVERPRGRGQTNEGFFKNHVVNDCIKLNDLGEGVNKYLLCFICRPAWYIGNIYTPKPPPFDVKSVWKAELEQYCSGINFICVEFFGGKVTNMIISPSDWIKLR